MIHVEELPFWVWNSFGGKMEAKIRQKTFKNVIFAKVFRSFRKKSSRSWFKLVKQNRFAKIFWRTDEKCPAQTKKFLDLQIIL